MLKTDPEEIAEAEAEAETITDDEIAAIFGAKVKRIKR
jgi:hypothetical protein